MLPVAAGTELAIVLLLGTLYFLALSASNVLWLRMSSHPPDRRVRGRVSILVPARDEEQTIARCLDSLLAQSYADYEIIVLDDQSSDRTWDIIAAYADSHPGRVRALRGVPLPEGWYGKPHAMQQLAACATGDLLLFTDADTIHGRNSVAWVVANLVRHRADLLSGYAHQEMGSLGEALVVPATYLMSAMILPLWMIPGTRAAGISFAIGQLLAVRRPAFDAIGGCDPVASCISDDVAMARAVKRAGFRTVFLDASSHVRCRMYEGYRAAVDGISKNIYDFFRTRPAFFAAALTLLVAFVLLPLVLLVLGLPPALRDQRVVQLAILSFLLAWSLTLYDRGLRWWVPLLYPVLFLHLLWMAWRCFALAASGRGVMWKGRVLR